MRFDVRNEDYLNLDALGGIKAKRTAGVSTGIFKKRIF